MVESFQCSRTQTNRFVCCYLQSELCITFFRFNLSIILIIVVLWSSIIFLYLFFEISMLIIYISAVYFLICNEWRTFSAHSSLLFPWPLLLLGVAGDYLLHVTLSSPARSQSYDLPVSEMHLSTLFSVFSSSSLLSPSSTLRYVLFIQHGNPKTF